MQRPAAIAGSLVDAKNVNTHKCVRLSIDVPAELARQVVDAFGWPTMANPVPVAVARLESAKAVVAPPKGASEVPKRRKWGVLPPAQQAAIRCAEPDFWRFLREKNSGGPAPSSAEEAAEYVRAWCNVDSRAALNANSGAAAAWRTLDSDYYAWQRGLR